MLTSDMAYVINDGDRQSDKFQHFVDMCCQAFNILRRHANLFINLFSLVSYLKKIPNEQSVYTVNIWTDRPEQTV